MRYLLLLIIIILNSCESLTPEYELTYEELLGKSFLILDEHLKDGTPTTRLIFGNKSAMTILEDKYLYYPATHEYKYSYTDKINGEIREVHNTDYFQVIDFYIHNYVAPGLKSYKIVPGYYNGLKCIMLVEMAYGPDHSYSYHNNSWGTKLHGDTSYLYEYDYK